MKGIKHWNSRTKLLLGILGVVVLAGVGVLAWGISTGKLSSSADSTFTGYVKNSFNDPLIASVLLVDNKYQTIISRSTTDNTGKYTLTMSGGSGDYSMPVINPMPPQCYSGKLASPGDTVTLAFLKPWVKGRVTSEVLSGGPGDGGWQGITVELIDIATNTKVASAVTDSKGYYKINCRTAVGKKYKMRSNANGSTAGYYSSSQFTAVLPGNTVDFTVL